MKMPTLPQIMFWYGGPDSPSDRGCGWCGGFWGLMGGCLTRGLGMLRKEVRRRGRKLHRPHTHTHTHTHTHKHTLTHDTYTHTRHTHTRHTHTYTHTHTHTHDTQTHIQKESQTLCTIR